MMRVIIDRVWRPQKAEWFHLAYKDSEDLFDREWFHRDELKEVQAWIDEHKYEWDIYFCPHGSDQKSAKKEYAVKPTWLWADLDAADPRKMDYKPTIAIESSKDRFVGLWLLDKTMSENLNKRMSYTVGADKGGWDLSQVLRVPGTFNYKRPKEEKVKLMWADGPSYNVADLKQELVKVEDKKKSVESIDPKEAYKAVKDKLSVDIRRDLLTQRVPQAGKRSEVLYKIGRALAEAGATREQTLALIKNSVWNKWADKDARTEATQLEREINNYYQDVEPRRARVKLEDDEVETDNPKLSWIAMHEVKDENADWIWFPFLARGELTILEGDPDLGKSYLMHMISKDICMGRRLRVQDPSDRVKLPPSKVFYCDLENSMGITKRRLMDNGMSEEGMKNFIVTDEMLSVTNPEDIDRLIEAIREVKPLVVVFDTVNTYLGKSDSHKGTEAQQAFNKFKILAKEGNCAVVVLRHVTKSNVKGTKAMYRGQGSLSMTGVARIVISMGRIPDEVSMRGFLTTKCNIGPKSGIMTFDIEGIANEPGKPKHRSEFVWGDWIEGHTAEDLMDAKQAAKTTDPLDQVKGWLSNELKKGPREEHRLVNMAKGRNYDEDLVVKALKAIGAKSEKNPAKKGDLIWSLKD